jgi:hypothetical protein
MPLNALPPIEKRPFFLIPRPLNECRESDRHRLRSGSQSTACLGIFIHSLNDLMKVGVGVSHAAEPWIPDGYRAIFETS